MDFEDAKENIQPLAAGRDASILHASLRVESPQELLAKRRELEQGIHGYKGEDPLEPWYAYISWIEQSFPSGGKESGLEEVLTKCLSRFENEERYFQDRRMIKLYMKFIDSHQNPMECYQQLFNAGIGTMVADFYICWAYHYDLCGNTRKADEIFRRGIACRAQPLEVLQEAHHHFGFTVAQRLMYQDDEDVKENTKRQFEERRLALTSLRGHRRKATVGSIRTGAVIKSYTPGTVQSGASSSKQNNTRVPVFNDENATPNVITKTAESRQEIVAVDDGKSVVRSIIDAARNQENLKEPGPWNKAQDKKSGKLFAKTASNTDLGFSIHEDIDMECGDADNTFKKPLEAHTSANILNFDMQFKYPENFKNKNLPQKEWVTPVTIENEPDPRTLPEYNKCFMYPRPNLEFQPEEYRAYRWFRKHGVTNEFTNKRDRYWKSNDININIRQYPNFAKKSRPQILDESDGYFEPEKKKGLKVCFSKLYDTEAKNEYQWEELMAKYLRRHDTILMDADMDETACGSNERVHRRKSFFPSRRSIMPRRSTMASIKETNAVVNVPCVEFKELVNTKEHDDSVLFVKEIPKECLVKTNLISRDKGNSMPDVDIKLKTPGLNINPTQFPIPFEIFEDTTSAITTTTATISAPHRNSNDQVEGGRTLVDKYFKFKTPSLPSSTTFNAVPTTKTATISNKLGFEIFTEASTNEESPQLTLGAGEGAVGGAIFDPEETCSTQTFNIFIKSQSVSTPKMPQKVAPPQFGSMLKSKPNQPEILSSSPESVPPVDANVEEQENIAKEPSEYSPMVMKQLSTILETSEHATTQGTHTTGGTKSSSNSTSDGEGEREIVTRLVIPHTELDTLEEQSRESSTMPAEVIASLENINLQDGSTAALPPQPTITPLTANTPEICQNRPPLCIDTASVPPHTPLQSRLDMGGSKQVLATTAPLVPQTPNDLHFSIFEDDRTEALLKTKQTVNFTRIDEREDTAVGYAIRSVRFQEDKTETISKALLHSRSLVKFQEDKTETLPRIPIAMAASQFEAETEQRMHTLPKLPKESSILLTTKNATATTANLDDSFEFFAQTPPGKSLLHPRYEVSAFKECMEARTPLSSAKRHCNAKTPDMMHLNPQRSAQKQAPALFEDEVEKINASKGKVTFSPPKIKTVEAQKYIVTAPSVPLVHKVIARDSFMPDFSLIEETQPQSLNKASIQPTEDIYRKKVCSNSKITTLKACESKLEKSADTPMESQALHESGKSSEAERNDEIQEQRAISNLGDCYVKDFSEIMDSQPQSDNKWHRSVAESQVIGVQKPLNGNICNSFFKDFSMIMESQPTEKDEEWRQRIQSTASNGTVSAAAAANDRNHETNFSKVMESQPLQQERDWRQNKLSGSTQQQKQQQQQYDIKEKIVDEISGIMGKSEFGKNLFNDNSLVMPSQSIVSERQVEKKIAHSIAVTVPPPQPETITTATKPTPESSLSKPEVQTHNKSNNLTNSYIKDFSFVPDSQLIENAKHFQQNKSSAHKSNPQIQINDSYFKELSLVLEAPTIESAASIRPTEEPSQKLVLEPATTTRAKPLLFLDSFMKDFSGFQDEPMSTKKSTTRLTFLNPNVSKKLSDPSVHCSAPLNISGFKESQKINTSTQNPTKLHFLDNSKSTAPPLPSLMTRFSTEKSFELNAETAMFSTNISMIKNSTLLSMNEPPANIFQAPTPIKEQSLHIKSDDYTHINAAEANSTNQQDVFKTPPMPVKKLPIAPPSAPNFFTQSTSLSQESINIANTSKGAVPKTPIPTKKSTKTAPESKIPQPLNNIKQQQPTTTTKPLTNIEIVCDEPAPPPEIDDDADGDAEMSIYFKHTPKTPKIQQHVWSERSPSPKTPSKNVYVHREVDLNLTNQIIDNISVDPQVNPFNGYLQSVFLEQIEFSNYIEELPSCMLVGHVSRLHAGNKVKINTIEFEVSKLVGEGAYGAVYCGVESKTGKKYALKQERPPNFWEYYICLEVHSRLNSDDLVSAFMSVEYALIGNNASILISQFSVHGSIITVCNKVKKQTLRNVDEYVVMLLTCELLSIIDHLHAVNIIHADIKADNFLLMKKLEYPSTQYALQLIDFGVSIDMKLFKPGQTFNYVHNENAFKCVEMREGRPWTYQLDLYGLAGVIHVLLFGKFMDITQRANGTWMHKTHVPRYINRTLWDTIFQTLLNVRNCETMPNLQNLRALIKEEIVEKEKFVIRKVAEFNSALIA